jgi:hypothetical protein
MNFSNLLQFEMELKMETKLKLTKRHWAETSKAGRLATAYWAARPTGTGRWPLERETGPGQGAGPAHGLASSDGRVLNRGGGCRRRGPARGRRHGAGKKEGILESLTGDRHEEIEDGFGWALPAPGARRGQRSDG